MPIYKNPESASGVIIEDSSLVRLHRPLPLHAQLLLKAILSTSARVEPPCAGERFKKSKGCPFQRPVVFIWDGTHYPLFPGSAPQHGRGSKYIAAARLQQPLLSSVTWAQRPLRELFNEVKEILEIGYGYDLDGTTPYIRGFKKEILDGMTLDGIIAECFETRTVPLVLSFVRKK